jgi:hypothetical protein
MTVLYLEQMYRDGKATLAVDHVNHREYIYKKMRYFMGWDSTRDTTYVRDATKPAWETPEYKVRGWGIYKSVQESS